VGFPICHRSSGSVALEPQNIARTQGSWQTARGQMPRRHCRCHLLAIFLGFHRRIKIIR
jgi:hypothetical protein